MRRHDHQRPHSDDQNPFVALAVVAIAFGLLLLGFYLGSGEGSSVARMKTEKEFIHDAAPSP
jgi:hypothetical protein